MLLITDEICLQKCIHLQKFKVNKHASWNKKTNTKNIFFKRRDLTSLFTLFSIAICVLTPFMSFFLLSSCFCLVYLFVYNQLIIHHHSRSMTFFPPHVTINTQHTSTMSTNYLLNLYSDGDTFLIPLVVLLNPYFYLPLSLQKCT